MVWGGLKLSGNGHSDLSPQGAPEAFDNELMVIGARLEGYLEERYQTLNPKVFREGVYRDLWTVLASLGKTRMFLFIKDDVVHTRALEIFEFDEARVKDCIACAQKARSYVRGRLALVEKAADSLVRRAAMNYLSAVHQETQKAFQRAATLDESAEALRVYMRKLARLLSGIEGSDRSLPTREIFSAAFTRIEKWIEGAEEDSAVLSFPDFPRLQAATGGLLENACVALIADTKSGKTTFVSALMLQLAEQGRGLLVPTEMSGDLFITRLATDLMGTTILNLRNRNYPVDLQRRYAEVRARLERLSARIVVLDGVYQKVENIRYKVEDMLAQPAGCRWVIVDGGSVLANRLTQLQGVAAYTHVSSALQAIAAELNVPVIATWQIGRKVTARSGAREPLDFVPKLHDANWSSAIEQDASLVLGLLYYDAYVRRGEAQPAPHVFPPGALTVHLLASRYGNVDALGTYTAYRKTDRGLVEIDLQKEETRAHI
jgi:replicative DNA helicase